MTDQDTVERIARIEGIVSRDPDDRRGAEAMYDFYEVAKGSLFDAAKSIAEYPNPHIGIISGFYLVHGEPPCCETDGPPGTAHLAAGLHRAGLPCRVVTDRPNIAAIKAAIQATDLPPDFPIDVASVTGNGGDGGTPLEEIEAAWHTMDPPLSHVVSIERVGPSADGIARNAHAVEMTCYNAPLERLFTGCPWKTIGIGDGGNELGMGKMPKETVMKHVRNGEKIACVVGCDYLMVCGVSNWGAIGLLAAVALLRPDLRSNLVAGLTREMDRKILEDSVFKGPAVSVATWHKWPHVPEQVMAVDGLPWEVHADVLDEIVTAMG